MHQRTRQGMSSPLIFNLLYQDLVSDLSEMHCGIAINNITYNLCCYVDDLLLCSLSVTGLQKLINGLRINPTKTKCVAYGRVHSQTESGGLKAHVFMQ